PTPQYPKWQFADVTFRVALRFGDLVEPLRTRTTSDRHFPNTRARAPGAPMNPHEISTSFLIATGHIRPMKGGAQSHMLTASDGYAYVVKFANNPQSLRVLANEWLACSIGRAIGLTIPEPAILYVPPKLVEGSPSLVIQLSSSTLKCSHGQAFGSRFISEGEVFDYLPESALPRVENVEEFAGVFALDKWLCNCDGRQAVFCRPKKNGNSALTSSTSAIASMLESGISRTVHYAAGTRTESSIRTSPDGIHFSLG